MTDDSRKRFYVYRLVDPRNGQIFYIGKGTGTRCRAHLVDFRAGRITNAAKFARIGEIIADGLEPRAEVLSAGLSEDEAIAAERTLIRDIGWGNLTNILPGSMSTKERAIEWAKVLLSEVVPFDTWFAKRPRTYAEIGMYARVVKELTAIARGEREFRIANSRFEIAY